MHLRLPKFQSGYLKPKLPEKAQLFAALERLAKLYGCGARANPSCRTKAVEERFRACVLRPSGENALISPFLPK